MEQIYDSRHSGQEVDKAVDAVQTTIPNQLTQIGSKIDELPNAEDTDLADFAIADENGFTIARFANGHVRTKYFDSASQGIGTEDTPMDLEISDEQGNAVVLFNNGHIRTKYFDSSKFSGAADSWLKGRTVAIIGDSISTNGNYSSTNVYGNVPEMIIGSADVGVELSAYLTYYDVNTNSLSLGGHTFTNSEVGTEVTFTPVSGDVGKVIGQPLTYNAAAAVVWWETAAEVLGFTPIPVCWSGADITSHRGSTSTLKCSYAWHESQIRKCGIRTAGTMTRKAPDAIIIYRGTNDFSHEPYTTLTDGYFDGASWAYPSTDNLGSTYGFKEGMVLTIKKLREAYPDAYIILCTLNVFKRVSYSAFPTKNGINSLPEYNNAIREIADFMGCGLIEFDKDGITFENIYPTYANDSATTPTHPNDYGHLVMAKKAINDLLNIKQR